jgi:hypothetical protein
VGAAGALLAASPAAVGVLLLSSPSGAPVGFESHPKPVAQEGRVVAVSADSLTAQSADGSARTYVVTPQTASVTAQGGGVGTAAFAINDEVSIVGVLRDGTAVATTVADRDVSNLNGPPMDSVGYQP